MKTIKDALGLFEKAQAIREIRNGKYAAIHHAYRIGGNNLILFDYYEHLDATVLPLESLIKIKDNTIFVIDSSGNSLALSLFNLTPVTIPEN